MAGTDIEAEITKFYRHGVQDFNGIHEAAEDFTSTVVDHVECADCHNPHRANDLVQPTPQVSGTQLGVTGISSDGLHVNEADFAYEICYKCHADNNVISLIDITRQVPQINTRLEFDPVNPSFHPVEAIGKNPDVPSLIMPLTETSQILCTDCHGNNDGPANGGTGPAGPHGSTNKYLLERNYTIADTTEESSFEYALCYKCHDENSILDDDSFERHDKHVRGEDTPCSACHDPHGVTSPGNAMNNSHLINFDTNIVTANTAGLLEFIDGALSFTGSCALTCHGEEHEHSEHDYNP